MAVRTRHRTNSWSDSVNQRHHGVGLQVSTGMLQLLLLLLLMMMMIGTMKADELPTCQPKDFHYEYTQCDSDGGRWRVSVPKPVTCIGGAPNPPVRGKGCDFTCSSGEYLDIDLDQECHPCPAGRYSLGGGVRYDDWETIPNGFSVQLESFASHLLSPYYAGDVVPHGKVNCTGSGWAVRGKYLASDVLNCTAVMVYTANLVRPGYVAFMYQREDDSSLFTFEVQNSRCETTSERQRSRFIQRTASGVWGTERFELRTGVNVIYWRVFAPPTSRLRKPVLIQSVDILGVAYTSECTSCKAGTYSDAEGATSCTDCPAGTYSEKGSSQCTSCDTNTQYSVPGSSKCEQKLACTNDDFYEHQTTCENNKTRKTYKWIEPKLCRDDLEGSVTLPPDGLDEDCPPCNPGMELVSNGTCQFCPANHFSDGSEPCAPCPGSTAAEARIVYKWWNNLPLNSGISSSCMSESGRSCLTKEGWTTVSDHIYSNKGNGDDAYLVLDLHVSGFLGKEEFAEGRALPVGKVSFTFETFCTDECNFIFLQRTSAKEGLVMIESWLGTRQRTHFTYDVTSTSSVSFVWAFQKRAPLADQSFTESSALRDDVARIYSIEVVNSRDGGADRCKVCPKGASQDGCIPCPEGQYVDTNTEQCKQCPAGTVARGLNPWGLESCVRCGTGLKPFHGNRCVTNCRYTDSAGHEFDFTPLASLQTVDGIRLFTTSGYKYYRMFQISLCAGGGDSGDFPPAVCTNNATLGPQDDSISEIQSPICRSTILPASSADGNQLPVSVQPISLSDVLIAVTDNGNEFNVTDRMREAGFAPSPNEQFHDMHFIYVSDAFTTACRQGRTTIVTLRCDPQQTGNGTIDLPSRCPDGTCDGCVYMFLWRSQFACPRCSADNYTDLVEECHNGKQKLLRIKPKDCFSPDGTDTEVVKELECSILWQTHWPVWLKAIVILVPLIICSGIILLVVVLHCWFKNKKLQYKYMKLIESAAGKDGELPAAETCALDEGEEDEQFDAVQFKTKGRKFFKKFKPGAKKDSKNYEEFHDVSNDHSSLLG